MYQRAHKRFASVILDIECYEDLDINNIDWNDILELQGDERVEVSIKEPAETY